MPNCRNNDSMPNVRASSGMMGTTRLPICGCFISSVRMRTKAMVLETSRPEEPSSDSLKYSSGGVSMRRAALRRPVKTGIAGGLFRNGDLETRAEMRQLLLVELLLLVGDIAAFASLAQAVALDGVGQDHRGPAGGLHGRFVSVINLARIVPAAAQLEQIFVAQVGHQVEQFGVLAEEILADVGAVAGDVGLHFAIHHLRHAFPQQAGGIAREQGVPIAAPDKLDDIPAVAAEARVHHPN